MSTGKPATIGDYIAPFPKHTREMLQLLRMLIREVAPDAEEGISYGMPAFRQNGVLVYFAGYARHIGFYPTASGIEAFKSELSEYTWSKGAIQFPLDRPLPVELVRRIVAFRIGENLVKPRVRARSKQSPKLDSETL
jgi:uncharacterized protein YdhG (YjbR/CyaY superfamily)